MITVTQIRGGSGYLDRHLSMNDYYSEAEKVSGQWQGQAAAKLGIAGETVTPEAFEALRSNLHPLTGEKLRPRSAKVAYHDFVISAPKSVSIAAMTGGDERLLKAFDRCVARTFDRLEEHAAARVRSGDAWLTEEVRITGNAVAAIFRHDTSRLLDPQLHAHLVFANLTWDDASGRWLALQPRRMGEESAGSVRREFYRDLERECQALGYRTEPAGEAFRLSGVSQKAEHLLSGRSVQRRAFEVRYREMFGRDADAKRVEQFIKDGRSMANNRFRKEYREAFGREPTQETVIRFVKDWRSAKMETSNATEVLQLQRGRLGIEEREKIDAVIQGAKLYQSPDISISGLLEMRPHHQAPACIGERKKLKNHRISVGKAEALRRMRRGMAVSAALRGHPAALFIREISRLVRSRDENHSP